jgi:hypothetical protein
MIKFSKPLLFISLEFWLFEIVSNFVLRIYGSVSIDYAPYKAEAIP